MINEIQYFIEQVAEGMHLTRMQSARAFQIIMSGGASPSQVAALLMQLRMKGESVDEVTGAAEVMRAKMDSISITGDAIDVCGTGGDNKGMLNVSTAVSVVVAACGVAVAKHGNKSVSSRSGSADVLAALGVNIQAEKPQAEKALKEAGIAFLFAPIYHKAMRHVAPVRQELGMRTIFNLLGPLCNPAKPPFQLLGVYERSLVRPMAEVLKLLGARAAWVVHGSDGSDELTLTGTSYVAELRRDGSIHCGEVAPETAGLARAEPEALEGGGPQHNAKELALLLSGKKSAYRDVVLFNAAAALVIAGKARDLLEGVAQAAQAVDDGKAKSTLAALVSISNENPRP